MHFNWMAKEYWYAYRLTENVIAWVYFKFQTGLQFDRRITNMSQSWLKVFMVSICQ